MTPDLNVAPTQSAYPQVAIEEYEATQRDDVEIAAQHWLELQENHPTNIAVREWQELQDNDPSELDALAWLKHQDRASQ